MKNIKLKIGDKIKLEIIDLTTTAEGVGKYDNFTIFVDNAVIGDVLIAEIYMLKKSYAKAKIIKMIKLSDKRSNNEFLTVGSELVVMKYDEQLKWKKLYITKIMEKILGNKVKIDDVVPSKQRLFYRNKCAFPVREGKIGVYNKNSHDIYELDMSPNNKKKIDELMRLIRKNLKHVSTYNEKNGEGSLRHVVIRISSIGEIMVVLVVNENSNLNPIIHPLIKYGVDTILINYNNKKTNVITGKVYKKIYGSGFINERIENNFYLLGPDSFFQVNHDIMMKIYNKVKDYVLRVKPNVVYDLYSGMGTIASHISDITKSVYAIELNEEAISRGELSAKENGINNIIFIQGKSEEKINVIEEKADLIIVDPPRKGLDESLVDAIIKSKVENIIYVSCKPSTLARDLKIFLDGDYEVKEVRCYDMFPNTPHVETVVLMSKQHIN